MPIRQPCGGLRPAFSASRSKLTRPSDEISRALSVKRTRPPDTCVGNGAKAARKRSVCSLPAKPDGVALLYQEPGTASVQCHPLGENLVVGRSRKNERNPAGCDLAFEDEQMSRRHFEIKLTDGFYVLRDLESRNGTYVNDDPQRIREHVLKAGDIILAGGVIFVFTGA